MTLPDDIFENLAKDILSGVLEPGRRLDEPRLCSAFNVSRTPVREALRRLIGTGLVELSPNRGVTVARMDADKLTEMYEALAEFEALCARFSAERMTAVERQQLVDINHAHEAKPKDGGQDFAALNVEFHECVYRGSHSPSIAGVTRDFRLRLAPFRTFRLVGEEANAQYAIHEHAEIVRAIVEREPERAHLLMRDHVVSAGLRVVEHFLETMGTGAVVPSSPSRSLERCARRSLH